MAFRFFPLLAECRKFVRRRKALDRFPLQVNRKAVAAHVWSHFLRKPLPTTGSSPGQAFSGNAPARTAQALQQTRAQHQKQAAVTGTAR
jgi:hypothetical protein